MSLRFLGFFLAAFALTAFVSVAPVSAQPAPVQPARAPLANFGPPQPLYDLDDLSGFNWSLHRELTGPAAQRVHGVYKDSWKTEVGLIPATLPPNGRFAFTWDGANENPDRFVQTLNIGKNSWTEWAVRNKGKAQYNAEPLITLNNPSRNELMFWWTGIAEWLETNKSSLDCGGTTKVVNDETAIQCLIPSLTQDEKISLADSIGLFTDEETMSVSNMVFELWVTKSDTIPVQLSVNMSIVDARNTTSTGVFEIDIFDIESDNISIELPR